MAKYKLKQGVILRPYGAHSKVDNTNLTDAMAELFIGNGKAKRDNFIIKRKKRKNGNSN